jgi:hypothetical protein
MSDTHAHLTIMAGRLSTIPFQTFRADSYSPSPGRMITPRRAFPNALIFSSPTAGVGLLMLRSIEVLPLFKMQDSLNLLPPDNSVNDVTDDDEKWKLIVKRVPIYHYCKKIFRNSQTCKKDLQRKIVKTGSWERHNNCM